MHTIVLFLIYTGKWLKLQTLFIVYLYKSVVAHFIDFFPVVSYTSEILTDLSCDYIHSFNRDSSIHIETKACIRRALHLHRDCSKHIETASKHNQGVAWTRLFNLCLTSADGHNVDCFG